LILVSYIVPGFSVSKFTAAAVFIAVVDGLVGLIGGKCFA